MRLAPLALAALLAVLAAAALAGAPDASTPAPTPAPAFGSYEDLREQVREILLARPCKECHLGYLKTAVPNAGSTLLHGVASGLEDLTALAFGLSFTIFSLFFLLKDGPKLRDWIDRHLGVPPPIARAITGDVVASLRRYFVGVTIVATSRNTARPNR